MRNLLRVRGPGRKSGWSGLGLGVFLLAGLSGCAATSTTLAAEQRQELMASYLSQVTKYDGINRDEALILAQSQLIFLGRERDYWFEEPEITAEDNDFWQVRFIPINRTLAQVIHRTPLRVTIRKANGDVAWSED